MKNEHKSLFAKQQADRQLGKSKRRLEGNISTNLRGKVSEGVDWVEVSQVRCNGGLFCIQ